MLYKFNCLIQPKLDSEIFFYFDRAISRRRILDKWFYFYINQPIKPIIIWKIINQSAYQIQPGTNRYIGVALRDSEEWIAGNYITNNLDTVSKEIKILNLIGSEEFENKYLDFCEITLDNPSHKWGVGDQTIYNADWIQPVYDWIHDNLKYQWGLEYQGKIYYINCERRNFSSFFKKTKLILKADKFPSLKHAVKKLFEEIKMEEFIDNQLS